MGVFGDGQASLWPWLPRLCALLVAASSPAVARASQRVTSDPAAEAAYVLISPRVPREGEPVRVLVARLGALSGSRLVIEDARGRVTPERVVLREGPTATVAAWVRSVTTGRLSVQVLDDAGRPLGSAAADVVPRAAPRRSAMTPADAGLWPIEASWDARTELLFSGWIATLFHVEPGARAAWNPLHQALRDPARNVLFDYLDLGEDGGRRGPRVVLRTDCADTLYALRAYFAWKLRLPFLAHVCSRGTPRDGPACRATVTNLRVSSRWGRDEVVRFSRFMLWLGRSVVHAGTTRTLPDDPESDFYPVALARSALRPGTIYVDAAGHVLMVSQWASPEPGRFGALFAIDGHPDTSVTHKRFTPSWFPFLRVPTDGFKAFRPPILDGRVVRPMTAEELRRRPWLPQPSMEQAHLAPDAFYARMSGLQNPSPVDATTAVRDAVARLQRAAVEREAAVEALAPAQWARLPARPFSGLGAAATWRALDPMRRELALLLAIEDARLLPWRAAHEPTLFAPGTDPERLRADLAAALSARHVRYRRSDGSTVELGLDTLLERALALGYGFHPGECPEARWGAPGDSDERATCRGSVPPAVQRPLRRFLTEVMRRREDPTGL